MNVNRKINYYLMIPLICLAINYIHGVQFLLFYTCINLTARPAVLYYHLVSFFRWRCHTLPIASFHAIFLTLSIPFAGRKSLARSE